MLVLTAALLMTACSSSNETPASDSRQSEPQAVSFGAYINRGTTRGGEPGVLTVDGAASTTSLQSVGFGVFAYYTDDRLYSQTSLPDFMYNQQVTKPSTASWVYSPVKYWPNETGAAAESDGIDHLSFFAYAPYAEVAPATGRVTDGSTTGITSLTRSNESGDPYVRYFVSFDPAQSVDLCWATPHLDQTKPAVNTPVSFNFKHALAALNVQISADIDVADHSASTFADTYTRIYVRSVTFQGFADRGQLNLNNDNTVPAWNNLDCDCDLTSSPITVHDGRRNGHEGLAVSLNERPTGLNPAIIQSGAYTVTPGSPDVLTPATTGVTTTTVNLFNSATAEAPIFVIPTNDQLRVTITYDVETYDAKLINQYLSDGVTNGSSIPNTITATVTNSSSEPITLEAGKKYTINLHLGMTSVKATATVTAWTDGDTAVVDVPGND